MTQLRKEQLEILRAYWSKTTYAGTGGDAFTDIAAAALNAASITGTETGDTTTPTRGIVTTGNNLVRLRNDDDGYGIFDNENDPIFGRLTFIAGNYRVTYVKRSGGAEVATTLPDSFTIGLLFPEVLNFSEIPVDAPLLDEAGWALADGFFGSGSIQDLTTTLGVDNITNGFNIELTSGDAIVSESGVNAGDLELRTGTATGDAGNIVLNLTNAGAATDGYITLQEDGVTFMDIDPTASVELNFYPDAGNITLQQLAQTTGAASNFIIQAQETPDAAGGSLHLRSGAGGGGSSSGTIFVTAADTVSGGGSSGGSITMTAGDGTDTNDSGGSISGVGGDADGNGLGGTIAFVAGASGATGTPGIVYLQGGASLDASTPAGGVRLLIGPNTGNLNGAITFEILDHELFRISEPITNVTTAGIPEFQDFILEFNTLTSGEDGHSITISGQDGDTGFDGGDIFINSGAGGAGPGTTDGYVGIQAGGADAAIFDGYTAETLVLASPGDILRLNATKTGLEYATVSTATPTLAQVLAAGNETGGNDIEFTGGDDVSLLSSGGNFNVAYSASVAAAAGVIQLTGQATTGGGNDAGGVSLVGGTAADAATGGQIYIASGGSSNASGSGADLLLDLVRGTATARGDIAFQESGTNFITFSPENTSEINMLFGAAFGDVAIAFDGTSGAGSDLDITGQAGASGGSNGGELNVTAGAGGAATVGAAGDGGDLAVTAGAGGTSIGISGGDGGILTLSGGAAGGGTGNRRGGGVAIVGKDAAGTTDGGDITLTAGSGDPAGLISLTAGDSNSSFTAGGVITITAGDAPGITGGAITITAGGNSGGGASGGGALNIIGGDGGSGTGPGGGINLTAGDGGSSGGNGGTITLTTGDSSGTAGDIIFDLDNSGASVDGSVLMKVNGTNFFSGNNSGITMDTNVEVTGKLTVGGLIDPTGLVLEDQAAVPGGSPAAGYATIWVRDSDTCLVLTDSSGTDFDLTTAANIITDDNEDGYTVDDYNPVFDECSVKNVVRFDGYMFGDTTITGIEAPSKAIEIAIVNISPDFDLIFTHADTGSNAANRILIGNNLASLTLAENDVITLLYDITSSRWRVI